MRRQSIATAAAIIALLAPASNDAEAANADRWLGLVIGDFTAGVILKGIFRPYAYGPSYDPHYFDPAYGPGYYGGTLYYYPHAYSPNYKPNPNYRHWTEF